MTAPEDVLPDPLPDGVYPFSEFRHRGFLWLVNAAALHPRGYALAFHYADGADPEVDEPVGWSIVGDGMESWRFEPPESDPGILDRLFLAVRLTLEEAADRDRAARAEIGDTA